MMNDSMMVDSRLYHHGEPWPAIVVKQPSSSGKSVAEGADGEL